MDVVLDAPQPIRGVLPSGPPPPAPHAALASLPHDVVYEVAGAALDAALIAAGALGGAWADVAGDWVLWKRRVCARYACHDGYDWKGVDVTTRASVVALEKMYATRPCDRAMVDDTCAEVRVYFALAREMAEFRQERRAFEDGGYPTATLHMRPAPASPIPHYVDRKLLYDLCGAPAVSAAVLAALARRMHATSPVPNAPWWLAPPTTAEGGRDAAVEMLATCPRYLGMLATECARAGSSAEQHYLTAALMPRGTWGWWEDGSPNSSLVYK